MKTSRRGFAKTLFMGLGTAFMFANTLAISACNIFTDILKYVPVGLTAINGIVNLLISGGIIPALEGSAIEGIVTIIKAGFADLQAQITAYENAPAADKQTILGKISTILADLQASLQQFWSDLNLPDGTLASTIAGLIGLIISTLAGFAASLPASAVLTKRQEKAARAPRKLSASLTAPKKLSRKQFEEAYNGILKSHNYAAVKF